MRLLVLGGGWFVGRAVVEVLLTRGHEVVVFNRGRSAPPPISATRVTGDRRNTADLSRLAGHGPWDAVIDVHGVVPRQVGAAAAALRGMARRYVLVSTVSAYRDWPSQPVDERSPVHPDADPEADPENWVWGSGEYGRLKAGAELAVARIYPPEQYVLLRPGVILGPGEYGGRLTWWLRRVVAGGRILAPGRPSDPLRPVDVRDMAAFLLHLVEQQASGIFNVAGPPGRDTWGSLLNGCLVETRSTGSLVWTRGQWLEEHGVRQWVELPMWRTAPGTWAIGTTRAQSAGLTCRPLAETIRDTWAWLASGAEAVTTDRATMHGMEAVREQRLLDLWAQTPLSEH
jgi:2'-hydroxyisoflavone reductase